MKRLLRLYSGACKNMSVRGRSWVQYARDVLIIVALPLSPFWLIITVLAVLDVTSIESDVRSLHGIGALLPGLAVSLIGVPLACVFIGTIAWFMHEVLKLR